MGAANRDKDRAGSLGVQLAYRIDQAVEAIDGDRQAAAGAAHQAAARLVKMGAEDVAVLKGGLTQWVADQYPFASQRKAP